MCKTDFVWVWRGGKKSFSFITQIILELCNTTYSLLLVGLLKPKVMNLFFKGIKFQIW